MMRLMAWTHSRWMTYGLAAADLQNALHRCLVVREDAVYRRADEPDGIVARQLADLDLFEEVVPGLPSLAHCLSM
jgi:hypothetical protein